MSGVLTVVGILAYVVVALFVARKQAYRLLRESSTRDRDDYAAAAFFGFCIGSIWPLTGLGWLLIGWWMRRDQAPAPVSAGRDCACGCGRMVSGNHWDGYHG